VEIERTVGGVRATSSLPAVRPPRAADRVRTDGASEIAPASQSLVFDEAIDIHLGVDRQTGHLAIVGGDVRVEPRPSDHPATRPGRVYPTAGRGAAPPSGPDDPPAPGSIVNVVA